MLLPSDVPMITASEQDLSEDVRQICVRLDVDYFRLALEAGLSAG